jgi:hypothetical protein
MVCCCCCAAAAYAVLLLLLSCECAPEAAHDTVKMVLTLGERVPLGVAI